MNFDVLVIQKHQGLLGIDNQHYVGNTYISLDTMFDNFEGDNLLSLESCLVFDRHEDKWKMYSPCVEAFGVCKSTLGISKPF